MLEKPSALLGDDEFIIRTFRQRYFSKRPSVLLASPPLSSGGAAVIRI
jgi:hypothetical protein